MLAATRVLMAALILVVAPLSARAQNWSREQQELLQHIQSCWDAWAVSWEHWTTVCPVADGTAQWWAGQGAPQPLAQMQRSYVTPRRVHSTELRPLAIHVDGDVAVIHFYGLFDFDEGVSGERTRLEEKRMEVFRRLNNRWTFLGGISVPVTGS